MTCYIFGAQLFADKYSIIQLIYWFQYSASYYLVPDPLHTLSEMIPLYFCPLAFFVDVLRSNARCQEVNTILCFYLLIHGAK